MNSVQVDILSPKANRILKELADLKLIAIKQEKDDSFLRIIQKLRKKAKKNPPAIEEITKEVEIVRAKRYAKKKR